MESGFGIIIVVRFTCRLGFGSSSMWHVLYDHVNVIDGVAGPCRRRRSHVQLQGGQGLLIEGLTSLFVEKHRLYKHWKFTMCPFWTRSLWDDKTAIDNVWQLTSSNVWRHMVNFYEVPVIRSYRLLTQLYFRCVALRLPAILSTWNSYCWNEFKFLYWSQCVKNSWEPFSKHNWALCWGYPTWCKCPQGPLYGNVSLNFSSSGTLCSSFLIVSTWFLNAVIPFLFRLWG